MGKLMSSTPLSKFNYFLILKLIPHERFALHGYRLGNVTDAPTRGNHQPGNVRKHLISKSREAPRELVGFFQVANLLFKLSCKQYF